MLSALETEKERNQTYWFVMRAYKNEKLAEERLSGERGLKFFIPKQYAVRVYHGVKQRKLVPVIPNLVFVNATHNQIKEFKRICFDMLQFVMWKQESRSKYLIVSDKEMENFIKIASSNDKSITYYMPDEINIKKGTRVRILGGDFDGVEGVFMKVKGKRNRRVVVQLEGVMLISAEVHPDLIEVLE